MPCWSHKVSHKLWKSRVTKTPRVLQLTSCTQAMQSHCKVHTNNKTKKLASNTHNACHLKNNKRNAFGCQDKCIPLIHCTPRFEKTTKARRAFGPWGPVSREQLAATLEFGKYILCSTYKKSHEFASLSICVWYSHLFENYGVMGQHAGE